MSGPPTTSVAVLIPTFRRPESLVRTLKSVFAQDRADLIQQIVVIDNSPEGSARQTVEGLQSTTPIALVYLHATPPGVATARNAGVSAVPDATYVAFIDDDEEAHPIWLGELFSVHVELNADVTFGPVHGKAPEGVSAWKRPYLEGFFSRTGPDASGLTGIVFGCGNSMMTRATALQGAAPFDVASNDTGGEDDRLFSDLRVKGAKFAWAALAVVDEHAPAHRANLTYALARAVSYGQSPGQLCRRRGDWLGLAAWMIIGAGQAAIYGALALGLMATFNQTWPSMADRAARGLGKLLWFYRFHFYGQGAAKFVGRGDSKASLEREGAASLTAAATNITQMKSL